MSRILTYISTLGNKINRSSLETLSYCCALAERQGSEVAALVLHPSPAQFVGTLAAYGAKRILQIADPIFAAHANAPFLAALEAAVQRYNPQLVTFASSEAVKDVLGAAGVRLRAAVLPDVVSFDLVEGTLIAKRPVQATRFLAYSRATADRYLVSVRPGSFEIVAKPVTPEIEMIPFSFESSSLLASLPRVASAATGPVDLQDAQTVVAAGRGVKDERARRLVMQLAEVLGAAVGATRTAVEAGLFPATAQIGQTGKVIAPQLYLGVGISGAIQHVAGIMNSRVIVAINKDPQAPIFDLATYGVVGDLYEVLPPLIERLRSLKSQPIP